MEPLSKERLNRTRLRWELCWAALTGQWLECVYTKLSSRPLGATVHFQTKGLAHSRSSAKLALSNAAPLARSLQAALEARTHSAHAGAHLAEVVGTLGARFSDIAQAVIQKRYP